MFRTPFTVKSPVIVSPAFFTYLLSSVDIGKWLMSIFLLVSALASSAHIAAMSNPPTILPSTLSVPSVAILRPLPTLTMPNAPVPAIGLTIS